MNIDVVVQISACWNKVLREHSMLLLFFSLRILLTQTWLHLFEPCESFSLRSKGQVSMKLIGLQCFSLFHYQCTKTTALFISPDGFKGSSYAIVMAVCVCVCVCVCARACVCVIVPTEVTQYHCCNSYGGLLWSIFLSFLKNFRWRGGCWKTNVTKKSDELLTLSLIVPLSALPQLSLFKSYLGPGDLSKVWWSFKGSLHR